MQTTPKNNAVTEKPPKGDYRTLFLILSALITAFLINTFAVKLVMVSGESMLPTLEERDWLIANRLAYISSAPDYGDVIVFKKADVTKSLIIKRIIGLPGDTVEITNGIVYINGKAAEDLFSVPDAGDNFGPITVKENCFFVLGDNRGASSDSRKWREPFVRRDEILGKVTYCF